MRYLLDLWLILTGGSGVKFRKLINEAVDSLELGPIRETRLRIAMRLRRKDIEEELLAGAKKAGLVPAGATMDVFDGPESSDGQTIGIGAIDWTALAKFLIEVLPAILALFGL